MQKCFFQNFATKHGARLVVGGFDVFEKSRNTLAHLTENLKIRGKLLLKHTVFIQSSIQIRVTKFLLYIILFCFHPIMLLFLSHFAVTISRTMVHVVHGAKIITLRLLCEDVGSLRKQR